MSSDLNRRPVRADVAGGGVIIEFADGTCAYFSSATLLEVLHKAQILGPEDDLM